MFSKSDFQTWGKGNVVLFAAVMTKIEGRKDDALLRTYGFSGFPSMALLDGEGEVITKKVARNLNAMRSIGAAAAGYAKMKKAVANGESVDRAAWFLARMNMGELKLKEAKSELAGLTLADDKKAAVDAKIFEMEMNGWFRNRFGARNRGRGQRRQQRGRARTPRTLDPKVADAVFAAFKKGHRLPAGSPRVAFFEDTVLEAAKSKNDAAAFRFAFPGARARAAKALASRETRLQALKASKPAEEGSNRARVQARRMASAKRGIETAMAKLAALDALAAQFAAKNK